MFENIRTWKLKFNFKHLKLMKAFVSTILSSICKYNLNYPQANMFKINASTTWNVSVSAMFLDKYWQVITPITSIVSNISFSEN